MDGDWEKEYNKLETYEPLTRAKFTFMATTAPQGSIVIDGGAHVGDTALRTAQEIAKRNSNVKVLAIEPDETKTAFMRKKAAELGVSDHVIIVTSGLYEYKTNARLETPKGRPNMWTRIVPDKTGPIALDTLDNILRDLGNPRVHGLKLDIEGTEYEALRGSQELLARDKPGIIMEIHNSIYQDEADKAIKELGRMGYAKFGPRLKTDQYFVHSDRRFAENFYL